LLGAPVWTPDVPGIAPSTTNAPVSWPVLSISETYAALTAPGAPFEMREEIVHGAPVRTYLAAPANLRDVLTTSRDYGGREFLIYGEERITFDAHRRAVCAFAESLQSRFNIRKGDVVAVCMRNFPEWSVAAWATLALGAILAPLNAWGTGSDIKHGLADSGARVAVVDSERLDRIEDAPCPLISVRTPPTASAISMASIIGDVAAWGSLPTGRLPDVQIAPDDDATLFYTSGTTGSAKGVVGTHRNITTNLINTRFRAARAALRRGAPLAGAATGQRANLLAVPLFHVTGFHGVLVASMAQGAKIVMMHKWGANRAADLIATEAINAATMVPMMAQQLLDTLEATGKNLPSLDTLGVGGAPAPTKLVARMVRLLPHATPGQGYGATETSSLVASNSAEDFLLRPASVGTPTPNVNVKLVGEDGQESEEGELWVRGANVVRGYWRQTEANASAFKDGWYNTGDIARRDAEGFLFILDRTKDMLIRGGENIYCQEVEAALDTHPAVIECAVFGAPHETYGETVAACVRLKYATPREDLLAHAATILPAHKRPEHLFILTEEFPRNAAGKILKKALRAALLAKETP